MFKPALSRGELQCIGATTLDEYRKYIEKDGALERRFQQVIVDPPSVDDSVKILMGLRSRYEEHHHVRITDDAIVAAVKFSDRYITNRYLPDKALDLYDETSSVSISTRSRCPSPSKRWKRKSGIWRSRKTRRSKCRLRNGRPSP
jgi:ATP-dependent Clp protease ATP-binding subunit ClpC